MRRICSALLCLLLAACASSTRPVSADRLLRDELFDTSTMTVDTAAIFALSDAMRGYLKREIAPEIRAQGPAQGLTAALYRKERLKLEYDAEYTRNASEAFDARSGNCLSLVLMTAAFARELGLSVRYQSAYLEESWSRGADLLVRSGHINITFEPRFRDYGTRRWSRPLTIDFIPVEAVHALRTREIDEETVIAMYLNNRAVEILAQGRIDDAYAHTRAAVGADPSFLGAYNTLGVIYARRGTLDAARETFDAILEVDPDNTQALANLAMVQDRLDNRAEADALRARLARLEPHPPFHYFTQGMAAMQREDFRAARDLFAQEVARVDYHEFHFWLAVANLRLGELGQARDELMRAQQAASTRDQQNLYAAKIALISRHGAKPPSP